MKNLPAVSIRDNKLYFNTSDVKIQEFVINCYNNLEFFFNNVLQSIFYEKFTQQQKEVINLISNKKYPYIAIKSWRGFGKTSLLCGLTIYSMLFHRSKFVLFVGSSFDSVSMQTEDIKTELMTNDIILEIFGNLKPKHINTEDMKFGFNKRCYFLVNPVTNETSGAVMPKGAGQVVRGVSMIINNKKTRPDLVLVDDLETDDMMMSEETMRQVHNWFHSALKNVVPLTRPSFDDSENCMTWNNKSKKTWQIIVMDTDKGENALINKLITNPEYKSLILPKARYEDGKWVSNVPEFFTDKDIENEVESQDEAGTLELYAREMLCSSYSPKSVYITRDMFKYCDTDSIFNNYTQRYMIVDPARTISNTSSYTSILCFGINSIENKIILIDYVLKKINTLELEQSIKNLYREYQLHAICVEDIGLKQWVKAWVENVLSVNAIRMYTIWLSSTKVKNKMLFNSTKMARFSTIIPYYHSGNMYHNLKIKNSTLENQLIAFPNLKIWDLTDCIGYIPYVIENEGLIFSEDGLYNSDSFQRYDNIIKTGNWRIA